MQLLISLLRSQEFLSVPVVVVVACVGGGILYWTQPSVEDASPEDVSVSVTADANKKDGTESPQPGATKDSANETVPSEGTLNETAADAEVARTLKLLMGSWTRESYGTRTLTIRADGTAKMVIKPSAVYAFVFGSVINVDVKWELQDGHIDYKVTGGTPTDKVDLAKKTYGDHWHEKIDKLDGTTLILVGKEGDKYKWTRVEEAGDS